MVGELAGSAQADGRCSLLRCNPYPGPASSSRRLPPMHQLRQSSGQALESEAHRKQPVAVAGWLAPQPSAAARTAMTVPPTRRFGVPDAALRSVSHWWNQTIAASGSAAAGCFAPGDWGHWMRGETGGTCGHSCDGRAPRPSPFVLTWSEQKTAEIASAHASHRPLSRDQRREALCVHARDRQWESATIAALLVQRVPRPATPWLCSGPARALYWGTSPSPAA